MKIEEIETIVKLMSAHDLTEFKIEAESYNLCIRRGCTTAVAPVSSGMSVLAPFLIRNLAAFSSLHETAWWSAVRPWRSCTSGSAPTGSRGRSQRPRLASAEAKSFVIREKER